LLLRELVTTTIEDGSNNKIENGTNKSSNNGIDESSNNGTNNGSNKPKPLVIGDPVRAGEKAVTKPSNKKQPTQAAGSSPPVTTVTTVTTSNSNKILNIGDRVRYTGTQKNTAKQYAGDLVLYELNQSMCEATCLKPDGKLTSWIDLSDLNKIA
jgi:hypothetical protein